MARAHAGGHRPRALVVQAYPLLGEGIAAQLRQRGMYVRVVGAGSATRIVVALKKQPCLVVLDRPDATISALVTSLAPDARLVDVSAALERGFPDPTQLLRFGAILDVLEAPRN